MISFVFKNEIKQRLIKKVSESTSNRRFMTTLKDVLCVKNAHPRDEFIQFQEEGHKYTITNDLESKYTSVTTWNHGHFPKFDADLIIDKMMKGRNWKPGHKYWGLTKDQIKQQWEFNAKSVSGAGTEMHFQIECFMNNDEIAYPYSQEDLLKHYETTKDEDKEETLEWGYFLKFVKENQEFKPYRTEWLIYDEDLKLSGSIDMVYENPDGTLTIYDWKRSKGISPVNSFNKYAETDCINHMPDSNFWHYSLQLNTYKAILERKYNKKITCLRLVRIHPNCEEETYELINVPDLKRDVEELFSLRERELRGQSEISEKAPKTGQVKQSQIDAFFGAGK